MKRYFAWIQYNGSKFSGWQSQPNARTVQDVIESQLSLVLRSPIKIVGCGRTDAGVHASDFVFHFDAEIDDVDHLIFKLNRMVGKEIAIDQFVEVKKDAHARFDAERRAYAYHIIEKKNPFQTDTSYHNPYLFQKDASLLNEVARIFLEYEDFYPFCKSNSDVNNTKCTLYKSEWISEKGHLTYHVEANRFLRGMVRLLVGCCLNVVNEKLSIHDVRVAFEQNERLKRDLSVPAQGLFLNKITYPEDLFV